MVRSSLVLMSDRSLMTRTKVTGVECVSLFARAGAVV